jgi:ABC-type Fe3+ transport system substrate-binding protein
VRERHPDWFEGPEPILEQEAAGEVWYDPGDRFYGACLSSFGLCFNPDRWQQLGLGDGEDSWPQHWDDLADPRLMGQIGAADPSKSGSITKCFEMLIQEKLAAAVAAHCPPAPTPTDLGAALAKGWEDAMLLIKEIGGNARYFTFSAGKVPVDVSDGAVVAGMCIDFYGRSQAEWSRRTLGRETLRYRTPVGGSSISADPIGLFRGAPHPETALMFIDFVLSPEGQRLWNYRVDTPGGPVRYSLRRLPIRRDLYADADRRQMADPEADPFLLASRFTYHPEWTGPLFNLMRLMIRVMIIDCHDELRDAWRAICENGGPETNPEAMELLARLPVTFADAPGVAREMRDSSRQIEILRAWAVFFRDSYRRARTAATATAR